MEKRTIKVPNHPKKIPKQVAVAGPRHLLAWVKRVRTD